MALPKILIAWELGANYGHISKIAEVVRAIAGRAEISVAVRDPVAFRQMMPGMAVTVLPAPVARIRRPANAQDRGQSYSDDLRHVGWGSAAELSALAETWRNLIALGQPDLLVTQAAPTALLGARGLNVRTVTLGSGYDAPPRISPMPPFFFWEKHLGAIAAERERMVLKTVNEVLTEAGQEPLAAFCDLLRTEKFLIASMPETDHYGPRASFEPGHPPYLGQLYTVDVGQALRWRDGAEKRIIAYLRPGQHGFDAAVGALKRLDRRHDVILAAPGTTPALKESVAGSAIRLFDGPVRLDALLPDCDLGISHASNGIAAAFLMAGVPQIGLPTHAEQVMVARAIAMQKLGVGLIGGFGVDQVDETIRKTMAAPVLRDMTRRTSERLTRSFPEGPGPEIARQLLSMF